MSSRRTRDEELAALRAELTALHQQLEFFQSAVDALPFPLFWKDADSVYMGSNQQQAVRAGLPTGAAIEGLTDAELPWTAEEAASFRADDRIVIVTGEPSSQIIETQRIADDADRTCQTHKAPLRNAEGEVIGVVGWYDDITDRETQRTKALLDDRLRHAHKLDSLGALAGGIAHDFNNILAAIAANVTLARRALSADHPTAEYLTDIDHASARALALVRQILTMSQPTPAQLRPVAVAEVVVEASRLLRATIPAGIELVTRLDPVAPLVAADPTQLHQVVVNLATNARNAIEDLPSSAGCIEIIVTSQELDASATKLLPGELVPGSYVVFSVRDNGAGMDAETKARIFEPFFTTRGVGLGTGLGLSVVHGIVTAHHGAITVTSSRGRGTTVRVYLPMAPHQLEHEPAAASRRPVSSLPPDAPARVLFVDDEPALAKAVARVLRQDGYHVTAFTQPREALEAFRQHPDDFDLLAVDYNMPNISGVDLAREVLSLRPDLPVIIASGFVTEALRSEAESLGADRVIHKANLAGDLQAALRELLTAAATGPLQ
jgi:signal transduction histidine kinase/CheY-like chemotaxis protein